MAATDSRKQLFSLIRDFVAEKSHGGLSSPLNYAIWSIVLPVNSASIRFAERRVFSLKKRIEELESELDVANTELGNGKRFKETTDQELKGFEVELSMNESSNQTLEVWFYLSIDELSLKFRNYRSNFHVTEMFLFVLFDEF